MKKISKKLSLARETVRVLSNSDLDSVNGGGGAAAAATTHHAVPTTTIMKVRPSLHPAAATPCVALTGGVHTAPCRYPG